ncbi:Alpha-soluble NSF attachment protein [Sarcoptes scabiei]|uniref:Alpha-soluble NSF attachment protein n=1 Tax=Sarcoptes scabiei TaxID=52283 RepID=A0A834V899_SARSC|nr:Alpha-soluble NSF attachment protein [Sarcoptes scabiei]
MADEGQKGAQLLEEAQKKLKISRTLSSFFSGGSRIDDAINLYVRADAGNAFCEAAQLHLKQNNKHDAGSLYSDAAKCFKKIDPSHAITADYFQGEEAKVSANKCLLKVAQYSALNGNFQNSAEIYEEVAGGCIESPLSRECKFLKTLISKIEENDIDGYTPDNSRLRFHISIR